MRKNPFKKILDPDGDTVHQYLINFSFGEYSFVLQKYKVKNLS